MNWIPRIMQGALVVTTSLAGCQPWTGNYEGAYQESFFTFVVQPSIVQIGSGVTLNQLVHYETNLGLVCDWTTTGCSGTASADPDPTFLTGDCTFNVNPTQTDCIGAFGSSFASSVAAASQSVVAGSVESFGEEFGFLPPTGGPVFLPALLERTS